MSSTATSAIMSNGFPCELCGRFSASFLPSGTNPAGGTWLCDACFNCVLGAVGDGQGKDAKRDRLAGEADAERARREGRR